MRIAIFGGTFDPIHNAHLAVARAARDSFGLQRVLMVPAAQPPHKLNREQVSYAHRYRMTEIACGSEPGLEASRLEERAEKSYSAHTIQAVREALTAADRLFFVIGADAFAEIETWYHWQEVVREVEFIVVKRPGHSYSIPEGAVVHRLESVNLAISSSDIRLKLSLGEWPEELPFAVYTYIREHGLYTQLPFGSAAETP